jgi:hypothetical protein
MLHAPGSPDCIENDDARQEVEEIQPMIAPFHHFRGLGERFAKGTAELYHDQRDFIHRDIICRSRLLSKISRQKEIFEVASATIPSVGVQELLLFIALSLSGGLLLYKLALHVDGTL